MESKRCRACGESKPIVDFYAMPGSADGRGYNCKPCHKAKGRERYFADVEKSRAAARAKTARHVERNREKITARRRAQYAADPSPHTARSVRYYWTHRESSMETARAGARTARESGPKKRPRTDEVRAREAVKYALRVGKLVRPSTCSRCERADVPIQAHHPDYTRRLDVVWICKWCHEAEHHGTGSLQARPQNPPKPSSG